MNCSWGRQMVYFHPRQSLGRSLANNHHPWTWFLLFCSCDRHPSTNLGYCKYSLLQEATHNSHCSNLCHSCQPHGRFKIQSCFMYSQADLNQTLWMKELNVLAILGSESMALWMLGKHSTISDHKWATSLALVILKQKLSILPSLALVSSCSLGIPRTCYPCVHCISRRVQHVVLPDFCHLEDLSRFIYIVLSWTCFPFPFLSK